MGAKIRRNVIRLQQSQSQNRGMAPNQPEQVLPEKSTMGEAESSQKLRLMHMPTEIHYYLQSFLDHPSLLNFSATNKHFRSLCPDAKVKQSLLCFEQCSLQNETLLTRKRLLPCYTCMKGLCVSDNFPPINEGGRYIMGSENASSRTCATCLINTQPNLVLRSSDSQRSDNDEWLFCSYNNPGGGKCLIYSCRYAHNCWLVECIECNKIKRYEGSPYGVRKKRYDEALLDADMCAACYQPVWDKENEERRARKNARARERYQEKKAEAKKLKEAAERGEQAAAQMTLSAAEGNQAAMDFMEGLDQPNFVENSFMSGFDDFDPNFSFTTIVDFSLPWDANLQE
jgi:hypothetical protein